MALGGAKKPFQSKALISFTLTCRKPSVGIHLLHEQNPPRVSSPPNAWIITSSSMHGHIFLSQPRSTRTPSSSRSRPPASTTPTTVEGHDLASFPDRQSQRRRSQRYQERRRPPQHSQLLILLLARVTNETKSPAAATKTPFRPRLPVQKLQRKKALMESQKDT